MDAAKLIISLDTTEDLALTCQYLLAGLGEV
ncbi:MAG: hypothetical protein ACI8PT_003707 [Gammaproteobacteria bacterium]|jgi:hypothetical protein